MITCKSTNLENDYPTLMRDKSNSQLYFVDGIRRRRVIHPEVAENLKELYKGIGVQEVASNELHEFEPGAVVPRPWKREHWIEPPQNKQKMREIITSQLKGTGVEFGAGSRPMPLPVETDVQYAEPFQSEEQYTRMKYSESTVVARLSNPIEKQYEIESNSLDFVVAAHVIEHTPNPIGAIVESFRCLKNGGKLVLVIPDKRRTFDKHRHDTKLDHLVADFESPDRNRDLENYVDFFTNAKHSKNPQLDASAAHKEGIDIHYHVWTPSSFHDMFSLIVNRFAAYSYFEIKPPVKDEQCLEFYLVATK